MQDFKLTSILWGRGSPAWLLGHLKVFRSAGVGASAVAAGNLDETQGTGAAGPLDSVAGILCTGPGLAAAGTAAGKFLLAAAPCVSCSGPSSQP